MHYAVYTIHSTYINIKTTITRFRIFTGFYTGDLRFDITDQQEVCNIHLIIQ